MSVDGFLSRSQPHFDRSFDRTFGTDTAGFVPLDDLTIDGVNAGDGFWYEPVAVKAFTRIMAEMKIDCSRYEFIDFGSGKGRALLLAAGYGFKRIVGVEFAKELHRVASENVRIYERHTRKPSRIETVCMDAADFSLPDTPLVLYFFSPFRTRVMERVLANVRTSLVGKPREVVVVFHGRNPGTIGLIKALGFQCREIDLGADWSRRVQYRLLILKNQEVDPDIKCVSGNDRSGPGGRRQSRRRCWPPCR